MSPGDIDWHNSDSFFLHNPKLADHEKEMLASLQIELPNLTSCIWILTSGSTSVNQYKWIALSKAAFLASAKSVNEHIQSDQNDIWFNVLPHFHVGGLAVWARAYLSGASVIVEDEHQNSWDPHRFIHAVEKNKATLISLVSTQIYDLVHSELNCPKSVRVIFIGGGSISEEIYLKARQLGYPLLPTYGMTEACSQVATASLVSLQDFNYPEAQVLSHLEVRKNQNNIIEIRGESLMQGIAYIENKKLRYEQHPIGSWYLTDDVGDVSNGHITIRGRRSELVKILGELVSFPKLRSVLELISVDSESTLIPIPDERKGHSVGLVFELSALNNNYTAIAKEFNENVAPFERATQIYFVQKIPKSPLGKIKTGELKEILGII